MISHNPRSTSHVPCGELGPESVRVGRPRGARVRDEKAVPGLAEHGRDVIAAERAAENGIRRARTVVDRHRTFTAVGALVTHTPINELKPHVLKVCGPGLSHKYKACVMGLRALWLLMNMIFDMTALARNVLTDSISRKTIIVTPIYRTHFVTRLLLRFDDNFSTERTDLQS